ncbi:MAG: manganese efflux pump MntP family protein [Phycisphaerae bacterium]
MSWLTVMLIALGLAMDAFAVSLAAGLTIKDLTARHVFRVGWHFGLFQFLMPVIGWIAGRRVSGYISSYDHWIAFGLLAFIGGKMVYEAIAEDEQERSDRDPSRGLLLVTLAMATSIDALAVGVSMAFLDVSIWWPCITIGIVAALMSTIGIFSGSRLGSRWGQRAEILGGLVLLTIGAKILIESYVGN